MLISATEEYADVTMAKEGWTGVKPWPLSRQYHTLFSVVLPLQHSPGHPVLSIR